MAMIPLLNKTIIDDTDENSEYLPADNLVGQLKLVLEGRLFNSVARTWRYLVNNNAHKYIELNHLLTIVLLVPNLKKSKEKDVWSVYNVADNKLLKSDLLLPPYDRPFCGSSEGWIGTLNSKLELTLFKSVDNSIRMVHLPPLFPPSEPKKMKHWATNRQWWVMRFATFTLDPKKHPNDFICVAIFGFYQLAYIRPSKKNKWILISPIMGFSDVVYHDGQFYVVTHSGILLSIDAHDPSPRKIKIVSKEVPGQYTCYRVDQLGNILCRFDNLDEKDLLYRRYLVESYDGGLLHVQRFTSRELDYKCNRLTTKFIVSKCSYDGTTAKWEHLESLGQSALFLGENTSISVLVQSDGEYQKNCIYFTHDKNAINPGHQGPWDLGIYNLETRVITWRFGIDEATFINMGKGKSPIFTLL